MIYGIISDTHNHNWSAFANTNENGINSRLQIILDETIEAAENVVRCGGKSLFHAGDLFHVRGAIPPSVLNPTLDVYKHIIRDFGLDVYFIPGNHDLEGKHSEALSNASTAMQSIGATVATKRHIVEREGVVLVPWHDNVNDVMSELNDIAIHYGPQASIITHAPMNDVIQGIPNNGLDPKWLGSLPFPNIFVGHYHNHRETADGIYSIGALTHQTFSDIGSLAGHVIVDTDSGFVTHYESKAPKFIDLLDIEKLDDVEGNYVRVKMEIEKESQIKSIRRELEKAGAAGVVIHPIRKAKNTADRSATVSAGSSLEVSVTEFVKLKGYNERVEKGAQEILKDIK